MAATSGAHGDAESLFLQSIEIPMTGAEIPPGRIATPFSNCGARNALRQFYLRRAQSDAAPGEISFFFNWPSEQRKRW